MPYLIIKRQITEKPPEKEWLRWMRWQQERQKKEQEDNEIAKKNSSFFEEE